MEEEHEDNVYDEGSREDLEESDEIDELEEGFMKGYDDENLSICANCHGVLDRDVVEEEIDGEHYRFCSERCATEFEKKKEGGR